MAVGERLQHLALDFDFLLGQSNLLELGREPRDYGTLRRGLAVRPALSPPLQARIFTRCAPLEPLTNSQDARRPDLDCSQFGLAKTLSSFIAVRRICQHTRRLLALTLHTGGIRGDPISWGGSCRRDMERHLQWSDVLQVCG